jgi:AraC family ethanolamine operon transcriptional activator
MPQVVALPYAFHQVFTDFDELSEASRQWSLDLLQLDRGGFHGELLQFGVAGAHVSEVRFGRKLLQKGNPPSGLRLIGVPASRTGEFVWRGIPVTNKDLIIFPRGADMVATSNPAFHVYTCAFPEGLLATISETLDVGELDALHRDASVIRCRTPAIELVRKCLGQLCRRIRNGASPADPELVGWATRVLPTRLLSAIVSSHGACSAATTRKRELALVRAEAFVERCGQENIDAREMSRVAQVSQRTLEYAFVNRFGMTPKAFLNAHRLNSVRRELRAANPAKEKVSDIANRWGFWHLGQFAADYRAQFDELPSQTLRRVNS